MSEIQNQNNEIANEIRRLLNLEADTDIVGIARSARLHFVSKSISISFMGTNKYIMAYLTDQGVIVPTFGSQQCPRITATIIHLAKQELAKTKIKYFYDIKEILNPDRVNAYFLRDLLAMISL